MFFLLLTLLLFPCGALFAADQNEQRKAGLMRSIFVNMPPITRGSVESALDSTAASFESQQQITLININAYEPEIAALSAEASRQKQHRNCPNT